MLPLFSRKAVAESAFAASHLLASSSIAGTGSRESPLASSDRMKVHAALAQAIQHSEFFEGMPVGSVKLSGTDWVENGGSRRLLVSATVHFKSLSNVYCGVAVVDGDLASATLVMDRTPIQDCRRIKSVAFVDINGDGDAIAQEIIMASNMDGTDASFYAVYLPDKQGYCFSSTASDVLSGVYSFDAKTLKGRFDAEKARRKMIRYECVSNGAQGSSPSMGAARGSHHVQAGFDSARFSREFERWADWFDVDWTSRRQNVDKEHDRTAPEVEQHPTERSV